MNKDKVINIILISVCALVFIVCLSIYLYNDTKPVESVVMVRDMSDTVGRITSDKNEDITNMGDISKKLEDNKPTDEEPIILKPETPDGMLDTSVVENPEDIVIPQKNTNGRTEPIVTNSGNTEPLPFYTPGEIVDIIREEAIVIPAPPEKDKYEEFLRKEKRERNKGRTSLSQSISILSPNGGYVNIGSLNKKGCVVIPFKASFTESVEYIKSLEKIYKDFSDEFEFIVLNYTFDNLESIDDVKKAFESADIKVDWNVYFDGTNNFLHTMGLTSEIGCYIINSDSYVLRKVKRSEDLSVVKKYLETLIKEEKVIDKMNESARQRFEEMQKNQ